MKSSEDLLDVELAKMQNELWDLFQTKNPELTNCDDVKKEKIFIWLFRNNKAADTLQHWRIYDKYTDQITKIENNVLLKSSTISGGEGTVGYVLKNREVELVNNTFLDPRGAVSYEDEIIQNYSWAGVPIPTDKNDSSDVDCVISFFYQDYGFFNLDESEKIKSKLIEIVNNYAEKIQRINQIKELESLNQIILQPRIAKTFPGVLTALNKVLSVNSKFYYTGILSKNTNDSFRLDDILFNTSSLENKIKDAINFCNICKNKCVESCFEKQAQEIITYTDLENYHSLNYTQNSECEVWQNYFKYLLPSYLLPIELGSKYKIFYYFSYPLSDAEIETITDLNEFFYNSFLVSIHNQISSLKLMTGLKKEDKEKKIILLKRTTETIFLILQLLVDSLYKNKPFEEKQFGYYIEVLKVSLKNQFLDSLEILLLDSLEILFPILQNKLDKVIHETSFNKNILATELWEIIDNSIQITGINQFKRMDEIKKNAKGIHNHSTLSVLKRAIEEEGEQQGLGNITLKNYSSIFFSWENKIADNGFILNENSLKMKSFRLNWGISKSTYLQSLKINEANFSSRVLNNIRNRYSLMKDYEVIFSHKNTFINSDKDHRLFPKSEQTELIKKAGQKIIVVGIDEEVDESIYNTISTYAENLHKNIEIIELEEGKNRHAFKSAIISILVDSYAHNISAHSLSALKWWFELRAKMLEKRIFIGDKAVELLKLQPTDIKIERRKISEVDYFSEIKDVDIFESKDAHKGFIGDPLMNTARKYYETLGLTDSTYNAKFYSLFDYLQFVNNSETDNLFRFSEPVRSSDKNEHQFNPRFPVPLDYALFPFFRFLRDKGAFWSGVTRDMAFGGESKTWYKILWDDFANNPLYLGTIAKSEGISKLNIHLAVKHEGKWIKGCFVTIDMSVIDYETEMANDADLTVKSSINQEKSKNQETNNNHCIYHCGIDEHEFSRYAFVRLGGCFQSFREILDTPEYAAFMPGGVVGEHALFTIFENTLRNIKHYKDSLVSIKENGIDFWISIEEDSLMDFSLDKSKSDKITSSSTEELANRKENFNKSQLFKVSTWLAHETEIFDSSTLAKMKIKDFDGNSIINKDAVEFKEIDKLKNKFLLKKVTDTSLSSILDPDSGAPRMGGNSQDKACAAMLFNNEFKSVERLKTERDKNYFPWIHFSHDSSANMMKDIILDHDYYIDETKRTTTFIDYLNKLSKISNKGILKKSFEVWRGEDYFIVTDEKELDAENASRFKIVVINVGDEEKKRKIKEALSEAGVIRMLEFSEITISKKQIENEVLVTMDNKLGNKELEIERRYFSELYRLWLFNWYKKNEFTVVCKDGDNIFCYIQNKNNGIQFIQHKRGMNLSADATLNLSHGSKEEDSRCNVRSHGKFWNYFFEGVEIKNPSSLRNFTYKKEKDHLLYEFLETVGTKVVIFDNRIFRKFDQLSRSKKIVFRKNLNLIVLDEDYHKTKRFVDQIISKETRNHNNKPHVIIMHLSFIENISDTNGIKYSEDRMYDFIKDQLSEYFTSNFVFIVITGRGRESWRLTLKTKDQDKTYINKTLFKPVESLLNAVESGISYNDNFDVKYHLCKIIFGS